MWKGERIEEREMVRQGVNELWKETKQDDDEKYSKQSSHPIIIIILCGLVAYARGPKAKTVKLKDKRKEK